jgi:dTDP-4-dehydrorhamnose reductase
MIWLVGSRGMLGTEVGAELTTRGLPFVSTDIELNITSESAVREFAGKNQPSWIINCAAYTAVDRAEEEQEAAYGINALGPSILGRVATEIDARLIHVSTDYIFSGTADTPYAEETAVNPVGAYGRTKAAGEQLIREHCPRHFIVRTAWLYGVHGKNFVETMLRLMNDRPEINVVDDQQGSPTYAVDLARALVEFISQDSTGFGTYHFTNDEDCTWHGFAAAVQDQGARRGLLPGGVKVNPIPTSAFPTLAKRPAYSVLAKDRIQAELGLTIPSWQDGLSRYFDQRIKERKQS